MTEHAHRLRFASDFVQVFGLVFLEIQHLDRDNLIRRLTPRFPHLRRSRNARSRSVSTLSKPSHRPRIARDGRNHARDGRVAHRGADAVSDLLQQFVRRRLGRVLRRRRLRIARGIARIARHDERRGFDSPARTDSMDSIDREDPRRRFRSRARAASLPRPTTALDEIDARTNARAPFGVRRPTPRRRVRALRDSTSVGLTPRRIHARASSCARAPRRRRRRRRAGDASIDRLARVASSRDAREGRTTRRDVG